MTIVIMKWQQSSSHENVCEHNVLKKWQVSVSINIPINVQAVMYEIRQNIL